MDSARLAVALRAMVVTYSAHAQSDAADRLQRALDEVLAGSADRAAVHAALSPRALPLTSVYPFDPVSQKVFYDAWDEALRLTADPSAD